MPISTPVRIIDDQVTLYELISFRIICEKTYSVAPASFPSVNISPTRNASLGGNTPTLAYVALAQQTEINNGVSQNYSTPAGSQFFDLSDGRGNGLLIPVDTLYINYKGPAGAFGVIVVNTLYRQKTIPILEFESIRSTFG